MTNREDLFYARALGLLRTIAEEAEVLNVALAKDEITQKEARARVLTIIGLAVTPEVDDEWPDGRES